MSTNSFRRLRLIFATASALMALGLAAPAFAGVQDNGLFELGNDTGTPTQGSADIVGSTTQAGPDWKNIFGDSGCSITVPCLFTGGQAAAFVQDDISHSPTGDRTVYSGGPGDKNSDIVEDWTWTTSSVPAKDDVSNAYAYAVKDSNGHLIIYAGAERISNNGDSHIDIEFFQDDVHTTLADHVTPATECPAGQQCGFSGSNTNGDILATMDFTNGGAFAGLTLRVRDSSQPDFYKTIITLDAQGCNAAYVDPFNSAITHAANTVCAFVNAGSIPAGGSAWTSYNSHGDPITSLPKNAFTEWGVDVTDLLNADNLCFSTIQVKTRSSQSFTATLKDFALHSFEKCTAGVKTSVIRNSDGFEVANDFDTPPKTSTQAAGTIVHDVATVTANEPTAPTPTGTVTFKRYTNATCAGTEADKEENVGLTGSGSSVTATSKNYTTQPGEIVGYTATYNPATGSPYKTVTSGCETFKVNKIPAAVTTDIRKGTIGGTTGLNDNVPLNQALVDKITVQGTAGFDPSGTVTVHRFTSANCSGSEVTGYPKSAALTGNGDGTATASDTYTPTAAAGEFVSWLVTYDGDTHYDPTKVADSKCEPVCAFDPISQ